ncbi:Ribosomal protein S12 methylthiotransferase [Frankliniella fusca]|uniref:Ribosomal protein S12 methylthiotransferase n=1 Tax=Frankliniella fusca TaxID=407009 RepID=A0AAE1L7P1_9NEOP|nr:Ribosomal protein S12 methylthiotransferase [Frankliniella fusca]
MGMILDTVSLSNDRLQRVKSAVVVQEPSTSALNVVDENEEISIGQWCAFVSAEKKEIFGRIMAFSFYGGTTWKSQGYSSNTVKQRTQFCPKLEYVSGIRNFDCTAVVEHQAGREIGCLCTWFSYKAVEKKIVLRDVSMDVQGYYNIKHYICTIPRPLIGEIGKLTISCSLKDIRNIAKGRKAK